MTEDDFWAALAPLPIMATPTYRLYYDDQGFPLFYSMEAVPGNYIELDAETWRSSNIARVVDEKIICNASIVAVPKLIPTDIGTTCHPNDVTIVVSKSETHTKWSLK
jgi:hypothetical protein